MHSTPIPRRAIAAAALAAAMASATALPAVAGHGYLEANPPTQSQSAGVAPWMVKPGPSFWAGETGASPWAVKPGPSSWAEAAAPDEIAGPAQAMVLRAVWAPLAPLPGDSNVRVEELTWQPGAGSGAFAMETSLVCELTAGELDLLADGEARTVAAGDVWVCPAGRIQVAVNNGTEPAVMRIVHVVD